MWRKFPELVEAPEFPEQLRNAFVEENEIEPDDDCDLDEEVLEPGHRDSLLPDAVKTAKHWMEIDVIDVVFDTWQPASRYVN
jgi:hypothetical protein